MKRFIFITLLILLIFDSSNAQELQKDEDLEQTIEYLLNYVAQSECTFIRNDREYNAEKASRHMKRKYEHFKEKIKTAEDFIRLAGTKSIMSKRAYRVRLKDGKEIFCAEWLKKALADYRESLIKSKEKDG